MNGLRGGQDGGIGHVVKKMAVVGTGSAEKLRRAKKVKLALFSGQKQAENLKRLIFEHCFTAHTAQIKK
jgi:hypothetical protein